MKIHEIDNGKYFVRLVAQNVSQHTTHIHIRRVQIRKSATRKAKAKAKAELSSTAIPSYRKSANQIRKSQHTTHIHIRRVQIRKSQHTTHIHIRDDCEQS